MRISEKKVNIILKKQIETLFAQTLADLKSSPEVEEFLNDFFTPSEKDTFSKRLAVAYWLKKGRSYGNIKENLKVSSATIAAIQELLGKKGVQKVIKNIEAEEWASEWSEKLKKLVGK